MSTEEIELEGLDYIIKFKERLDIIVECIFSGRDCLTEDDYNVLREVYRIERDGNLPLYKTIASLPNITSTQPSLFSQDISAT